MFLLTAIVTIAFNWENLSAIDFKLLGIGLIVIGLFVALRFLIFWMTASARIHREQQQQLDEFQKVAKSKQDQEELLRTRIMKLARAMQRIERALEQKEQEAAEVKIFGQEESYHGDWEDEKVIGEQEAKEAASGVFRMLCRGVDPPSDVDRDRLIDACQDIRSSEFDNTETQKAVELVYTILQQNEIRNIKPPTSDK